MASSADEFVHPCKTGAIVKPWSNTGQVGGRNALQESRRRQTREALLAAAGEVFGQKPYLFATIDDIIRAAKVSRASFYMHFESKLALASTIVEGITANWQFLFKELPGIDKTDIPAIEAWIERLVQVYRNHGYISVLVVQLDHFENEFHDRVEQMRVALIEQLARHLPSFRTALQPDHAGARARAAAHLLFQRLDHLCSEISLRGGVVDVAYQVRIVAEEISTFLIAPTAGRFEASD